jgi:hypothetical protein
MKDFMLLRQRRDSAAVPIERLMVHGYSYGKGMALPPGGDILARAAIRRDIFTLYFVLPAAIFPTNAS